MYNMAKISRPKPVMAKSGLSKKKRRYGCGGKLK
jgi:hypothetical protein